MQLEVPNVKYTSKQRIFIYSYENLVLKSSTFLVSVVRGTHVIILTIIIIAIMLLLALVAATVVVVNWINYKYI